MICEIGALPAGRGKRPKEEGEGQYRGGIILVGITRALKRV